MPWSLTPRRRHDPELMDAPGLPAGEVADAYRVLRRVNRQFFGSLRSLSIELDRFLAEDRPEPGGTITALDVGAGSGDLAQAILTRLSSRGFRPLALSLDRDPVAARLAGSPRAPSLLGDALRLPFADRSVDVVTGAKFAHHFSEPALSSLLAEMARVARRRVIVLDLRRHWLAYWGFVAWSRLFTTNRLVRFDGPLSVLRGFTPEELAALAAERSGFAWTVRRYAGFQLALVGQRNEPRYC
jgi:hypothetical protein